VTVLRITSKLIDILVKLFKDNKIDILTKISTPNNNKPYPNIEITNILSKGIKGNNIII